MRIITGIYKGRRLASPSDHLVRPTPDRVKEALFSMLGEEIEGAVVLDLFAGSGNLGLEALSRGAKRCYFGDNSRESIRLVQSNVAHCKAQDHSHVILGDYRNILAQLREPLDIVFLDPPYKEQLWFGVMEMLNERKLMNPGGLAVLEHPKDIDFPQELFGFRKIKERRYGTVVLSIYMC